MSCRGYECTNIRVAEAAGLLGADGEFEMMTGICQRVTRATGTVATTEVCPFSLAGDVGGAGRSGASAVQYLLLETAVAEDGGAN